MMEELEEMLAHDGVFINAEQARVCCIAHIVHLAALKVREHVCRTRVVQCADVWAIAVGGPSRLKGNFAGQCQFSIPYSAFR